MATLADERRKRRRCDGGSQEVTREGHCRAESSAGWRGATALGSRPCRTFSTAAALCCAQTHTGHRPSCAVRACVHCPRLAYRVHTADQSPRTLPQVLEASGTRTGDTP